MATLLACIRASPLALRPLRPLTSIRSYCDQNDQDGTGRKKTPKQKKKLSLDELLQRTKVQKPPEPIALKAVKPPRKAPLKVPDIGLKTARIAQKAAEELPGDVQQNLNELLGQLKEVSEESRKNLEELFVGMKIDRTDLGERTKFRPDLYELNANDVVRDAPLPPLPGSADETWRPQRSMRRTERPQFELFSKQRLGIFNLVPQEPSSGVESSLPVWDQLEEREMRLARIVSPRNGFEEMIRWTEEGKLWPFPIDNEYGMVEEPNVRFEDHVFLDHLIEDDHAFPPGPVKHFMELVCVGLSKNPYISVERKHKCIEWYRDYFISKKKLIEASLES